MREIFEILNAGGIFMYAILATSIVSVGVILQRVYTLFFEYRIDEDRLHREVSAAVAAGDFGKALQISTGNHPLERMVQAALQRANRSEKEIRRGVETTAVGELSRYRKGTATLPQLSNLATLLGLLGTIHGLIISFSGMQGVDAATRQAALSRGVAVAFYNTFFGLTVATTTVVAYLLISVRQGRGLTRMESVTAQLVDQLLTSPESRAGGQSGPAGQVLRIQK